MQCSRCGRQLDDEARFCPWCGTPVKGTQELEESLFDVKEGYDVYNQPLDFDEQTLTPEQLEELRRARYDQAAQDALEQLGGDLANDEPDPEPAIEPEPEPTSISYDRVDADQGSFLEDQRRKEEAARAAEEAARAAAEEAARVAAAKKAEEAARQAAAAKAAEEAVRKAEEEAAKAAAEEAARQTAAEEAARKEAEEQAEREAAEQAAREAEKAARKEEAAEEAAEKASGEAAETSAAEAAEGSASESAAADAASEIAYGKADGVDAHADEPQEPQGGTSASEPVPEPIPVSDSESEFESAPESEPQSHDVLDAYAAQEREVQRAKDAPVIYREADPDASAGLTQEQSPYKRRRHHPRTYSPVRSTDRDLVDASAQRHPATVTSRAEMPKTNAAARADACLAHDLDTPLPMTAARPSERSDDGFDFASVTMDDLRRSNEVMAGQTPLQKEASPKRRHAIVAAVVALVAVIAVFAGVQVAQNVQAHATQMVTVDIAAPGYNAATDSPIELYVSGTDLDGAQVDDVQYVTGSQATFELRRGTYRIGSDASPLLASGAYYSQPSPVYVTVDENGVSFAAAPDAADDDAAQAAAQGTLAFTQMEASLVSDEEISKSVDLALIAGYSQDQADAARQAIVQARTDAQVKAAYAPVIEAYKALAESYGSGSSSSSSSTKSGTSSTSGSSSASAGQSSSSALVNSTLATRLSWDAEGALSYVIEDLNGDGTPELLVALVYDSKSASNLTTTYRIFDVYTMVDGGAMRLATEGDMGTSSIVTICTDGYINETTYNYSVASDVYYGYLTSGSNELTVTDHIDRSTYTYTDATGATTTMRSSALSNQQATLASEHPVRDDFDWTDVTRYTAE